jgi:hypothetical protein
MVARVIIDGVEQHDKSIVLTDDRRERKAEVDIGERSSSW